MRKATLHDADHAPAAGIEVRDKRRTGWVTTVTMRDGSARSFEPDHDPKRGADSVVEVADGKPQKH
jgi:hypothetical protein